MVSTVKTPRGAETFSSFPKPLCETQRNVLRTVLYCPEWAHKACFPQATCPWLKQVQDNTARGTQSRVSAAGALPQHAPEMPAAWAQASSSAGARGLRFWVESDLSPTLQPAA